MHKYEQPNVEVISFRPDESLMDENLGDGLSGGQGGGSPYDARDNR